MNNRNSWVPEGWGYEPPDRSVGIMGESIFHDECPDPIVERFALTDPTLDATEYQEPLIIEIFIGYRGNGFNRVSLWATTWICLDCGDRVSFLHDEWDPDTVEELKQTVLREVERGDPDDTPRRRWDRFCHDYGYMPGDFDVTPAEYEAIMREVFGG